MARPKGDGKGRLGGRVKGTPNKSTSDARKILVDLINNEAENARKKLSLIADPKDWVMCYCKLCEFCIPKMASVQVDATTQVKTFSEELDALDRE